MKRRPASLLTASVAVGIAAAAPAGCGNLLGIEVLSYDGGDEGSAAVDGAGGDSTTAHDAGPDGPAKGDASADGSGGDATSDGPSGADSTAPDGSGADAPQDADGAADTGGGADTGAVDTGSLVEAGCATGATGCTGNTPWTCVGGTVTTGAACSNQTCVGGACVGVCAPGQTQCTAGSAAYQTCKADGTWGTTATCTGPVGGSPTCNPATGCGPGACTASSLPNLCGTSCVNLTSDGYNCGVCGQTCTGSTCAGGYCAVQPMCDGTPTDGGAPNAGNPARLGLEMGVTSGLQKVLYGYFAVGGSVYGCTLPATAPSPPSAPILEIQRTGPVFINYYDDVVSDKDTAYTFDSLGGDLHGNNLDLVPSGSSIAGATFGTLEADVTASHALYTLSSPTLDLVSFTTQSDGGITTSSVPCITVSGTLGDGAAGGGSVVGVDTSGGVIRGATASAGACSASIGLATGVTAETAVAVASSGALFAYGNATSLYVCPTTGCTAAELSTPYVAAAGAIARNGLVFDGSSPPSMYWVGPQGLSRCSAVAPGGTCTPTVLVPGVAPTSGIALDATYVYYLEGMILYRVPR